MLKVLLKYTFLSEKRCCYKLYQWNQFLYDVAKFTCFRHDLLHSIPQRAEIEAKEIGLQEKKVIISFKFVLRHL